MFDLNHLWLVSQFVSQSVTEGMVKGDILIYCFQLFVHDFLIAIFSTLLSKQSSVIRIQQQQEKDIK